MKAIVSERYGPPDALELRDVDKPALEPHQVLVRVHASSVNPAEWYRVTGRLRPTAERPASAQAARRGHRLCGTVEAVGPDVKEFQPGDEVFGAAHGAWAEYAAAREARLVPKPANVSFEEAASVPIAAITALQALRDKARCSPGSRC